MRRYFQSLLFAASLLALAVPAGAQQATVVGRVVAESGAPLPGVQVFIFGSTRGTITNQDGRYIITGVSPGQKTVRATLIGYKQGEAVVQVAAGATATADFVLEPSAVELNAVVVNVITGQAEQKRELGTNTATIQAEDLQKAPIVQMADVLTGRAAGVSLQGVAGTTGTSQRIRIRGANSLSLSNEPLIFVDGVQFSNDKGGIGVGGQEFSRLNDLNPQDIENVEILKGPAASAMYGTAAANGVILITTKRGNAGAPSWRFYAEGGMIEDRNQYPTNFLAVETIDPNAPLFTPTGAFNTDAAEICRNLDAARGRCVPDRVVSFNPFEDPQTTPFDEGSRQQYGASVAGGSETVRYYISGDYEDEVGVINFNTLETLSLRANVDTEITDKLSVQVTSNYVNSDVTLNQNDNNIFSPLINSFLGLPVRLDPGIDEAAGPFARPSFGFGLDINDIRNIVTNQAIDRFIIGGTANYKPLTWLAANATVGLDFFSRYDYETLQPEVLPLTSDYLTGYRQSVRSNSYLYTANTSLIGTFQPVDDVALTSTVGATYERDLFENTECFGFGIVQGTRSCGATSAKFDVDEAFSEVITVGAFFRQQLAWRDRLFLSASIRGDDNSAFGEEADLIWLPSASASWVVSEEPFFPQTGDFLSNLRLRAAVGRSALRPGFRDAVTLLSPVAVTIGGQEISAVTLSTTGNELLEPEKSTEYEFGGDAGFFDDRLSFEFTYFNKTSEDALISRNLPPSLGLTGSRFENLGEIRNSGTEWGISARALDIPQARLNVRANLTTLDNEIVELGEGVEPITLNRGNQRHQEGFPAGAFFGRTFEFDDANGDGLLAPDEVTITSDTAVFQGASLPTNTQSLALDLTVFGNLTISTLFDRRAGHKQLNYTESFRCRTGFARFGRGVPQGGCAAVANPDASLEDQAAFIADRVYGVTTGYIEDADFIKWRELAVTVGAPTWLSRYWEAAEGASITFSGRNLKTWTDYSGLDPEINETGGNTGFTQGEFNTQPPVTYYTVRLNFTF